LCGTNTHSNLGLCSDCIGDLRRTHSLCKRCALPLETIEKPHVCGNCLREPPPYAFTYSFAEYAPPLDRLIQQLKFHQKLHIARLLGELMALDIQQQALPLPDLLLPVPLHNQRMRQRGYNQAAEVARILARVLGLTLDIQSCTRSKITREQSGLSAKRRKTNIKGAFQVGSDINARHIAIVDDVMTTGSTVGELSQALLDHGAKRVDVWVCARANL